MKFRTIHIMVFVLLANLALGQTYHFGGGFTYMNHFMFNKNIKFEGNDSTYVFSSSWGGGIMAAAYFDPGAYYFRKLYGVKAELQFSQSVQSYKVYPGKGLANAGSFYKFRTQANYLDVPVLFNFCNSYHQGFTVDGWPAIFFS